MESTDASHNKDYWNLKRRQLIFFIIAGTFQNSTHTDSRDVKGDTHAKHFQKQIIDNSSAFVFCSLIVRDESDVVLGSWQDIFQKAHDIKILLGDRRDKMYIEICLTLLSKYICIVQYPARDCIINIKTVPCNNQRVQNRAKIRRRVSSILDYAI